MNINEILVVDDDHSVLEALGETLKAHGYSPLLTQSPEKALELLIENPYRFSLILLDWKLNCPVDGDMVLHLVKSKLPDFKTPVIAITAHTGVISKYLMRLGAFDTLSKPFSTSDLIDAIERALKKKAPEDPHLRVPVGVGWQTYRKNEIAKKLSRAIGETRSLREAARQLKCSEMTLHRWLKLTGLHGCVMKLINFKKEHRNNGKDT